MLPHFYLSQCSTITMVPITMRHSSFHSNALILQENNTERWDMDYHHDNPTFFTIVKNTKLLKLPEKFLKHLMNEDLFSSDAIVIGPSGEQWQVTLLKKGNCLYMKNDWPQFLRDNSVLLDEFLLFTYHGENHFQVQIFSKNGCERLFLNQTKQQEAATPRTENSPQRKTSDGSLLHEFSSCQEDLPLDNKGSLSNGRGRKKTRQKQTATPSLERTKKSTQRKTSVYQEDLPFSHKGKLCNGFKAKKTRQEQAATPSLVRTNKSKRRKSCVGSSHPHEPKSFQEGLHFSCKGPLLKDFRKPKSPINIESSKAYKLAESFTSCNPHWKHLLTKCNVEHRGILPIATEFARNCIPEAVKQIILWNSEGNFWEVEVFHFGFKKSYARFTTGWGRFVRDNKLMRGDTCIFELEDENQLSVHIFRATN